MIRIQQIKLPLKHNKKDIEQKVRKLLRLKPEEAFTYRIFRQSIDARRKNEVSYVYTVDVEIGAEYSKNSPQKNNGGLGGLNEKTVRKREEKRVKKLNHPSISLANDVQYTFSVSGKKTLKHRPVIVGSGPAGLFCAYLLAKNGYRPLVLERGKEADRRRRDVERFWQAGALEPDSNVQFGEGGAGTFSDGKLNTLVKDHWGRSRFVLETFVRFGADSGILYVHNPHIGTDCLIQIVQNMRREIIRLGGEFAFEACLMDIKERDGRVCSVTVESGGTDRKAKSSMDEHEDKPVDALVLATGHSARDTFAMLMQKGLSMEAKPFAVGFRVEHPQGMINERQYKGADMRYLPPASYKVSANFPGGRGVYSFCMCPGGFVVNASSEPGRLAVNGMSYQARDGENANSAVIVSVTPEDFSDKSPLGGVLFQRELELRAYQLGGGKIPQQLYGDFVAKKCSKDYGEFASQAKGACAFADLNELMPTQLREPFLQGMEQFARRIPGFDRYDAVLSGIESRTSSPVRILRGEDGQSRIKGIFPCGEGAGYAGGIMSAAMDGMKTAEKIAALYQPLG